MTVISRETVLAELGAFGTRQVLPAAVMAEYARAAMLGLCDGPPVTAQRLAGETEDLLAPLLRFRSRAFESYFSEPADESETPTPRQVIEDLAEIGDFIDVGGGYHYPAPIRAVSLDCDVKMIVGAAPVSHLAAGLDCSPKTKTVARLTRASNLELREQTLQCWLGAPSIELKRWTKEQFAAPLECTAVCADAWEAATFEVGRVKWTPAPNLSDLAPVYICREPRENIKGHRKFLARFARIDGVVSTTGLRPISNTDCSRMIHGAQLALGLSRRVWAKTLDDWIAIQFSRYTLPEILRLFKALCYDWRWTENERIEFVVPIGLRSCIQSFLARYAMHLPSP